MEEEKWKKFLKAVGLFRFVPFTDFVMASGSLATGTLRESSDFDVLIGVRQGRIFTNRFFAVLIFGITGNFKHNMHERGVAKDMICLNHFVTPKAYKFSPPYTDYDQEIYQNLILVFGDEEKAKEFIKANDWLNPKKIYERSDKYLGNRRTFLRRFIEFLLDGSFGNLLEELKFIQIKTIHRGSLLKISEGARFKCDENELEFHIGSARTIKKWKERKMG